MPLVESANGDPEQTMKATEMEKTTNREEEIFLAALELNLDVDRLEFLKKQCGDDFELLKRVEELLDFHQRGNNILDDTSGGFLRESLAATDSLGVGSHIGPYKLLQEIGIGGMGVVFMAEQSHPVRRKVAVKIIKLGMDTRNVIARFEAERQALAMMDHPNITKVFDAGSTTTGRPYFVMELVTGLAITDYCDREKLSLRARIELFHQVCVGIKHAHQKGIIHRDLKPSNVMVTHYDGIPVPKIIDFGIAKAVDQTLTDKTLFTSYGNMIGTPEYMSPEQAEMSGQDIDTRADVYSLGVLMYELLTGTTPFQHWKKKGIHKFCEAICNEEPELASTRVNNLADTVNEISRNRGTDVRSLRRILRGDMDWILTKCMSKNRNERYESAADLARDVKRYLDGQPIEAVGPNLSYKARKYVRKHRTSMSIAAIILLTLVSATIVSTVFAFKANSAQKLANSRLLEVDQLRKTAENERDRALAAERQLQELEMKSRMKAMVAIATEKHNKRYPNERVYVRYPESKLKHESKFAMFNRRGTIRDTNILRIGRTGGRDVSANHVIDIAPIHDDSAVSADMKHKEHTYQIVIGDTGELRIAGTMTGAVGMVHTHDPQIGNHFVIIQDHEGEGDKKRFLQFLVDEQREFIGPENDVVAHTLYAIGNESLLAEEWSEAENHFRESRDILKLHANKDEQMAKVELQLSKALLRQRKHAAARETIKTGVGRLIKLHKVPNELLDVMEELRGMDITVHEFGELLPADLQKELNIKLHHQDVEIEFHTKKK